MTGQLWNRHGAAAVLARQECLEAGLRAPLARLAVRLDVLRGRLSSDRVASTELDGARAELARVQARLEHLLSAEPWAEGAPVQVEPVALSEVVGDVQYVLGAAESGCRIQALDARTLDLVVQTDGLKLRHLLFSLLEFSCHRVCPEGSADVTLSAAGGLLTVAVEDAGPPVAEDGDPLDMLAGIRHLAEALGGHADVMPLPAGLRVSAVLPIDLRGHRVAAGSDAGGFATVLVIDGDTVIHELLTEALNRDTYGLMHAFDEAQGFHLATELLPDIIVLNVLGREFDGWGLLARLKNSETLRHVPVVVLTLAGEEEMGYLLRASDFLTKPFRFQQLLQTANRYRPPQGEAAVLVVEDDDATRTILCGLLERDGWRVKGVANAYDGLRSVEQFSPNMVLLDLMMPGMDGFQFLKIMRMTERDGHHRPVVVVTAKDLTDDERQWLAGKTRTMVSRYPVSRSQLVGALRNWVTHATARGTVVV